MADTWEYRQTIQKPASVTSFGSGCAGSAGIPQLSSIPGREPWVGETAEMSVGGIPAGVLAQVFGLLGVSATAWGGQGLPLGLSAIGMTGCSLHVSVNVAELVPRDPAGTARWRIPVPNDASLACSAFYLQCFVLDRAANPLGATMTNALNATVGLR